MMFRLSAAQLKRSLSSVSQLPAMDENGAVDSDAQVAADFEVAQLMEEVEIADDAKSVWRGDMRESGVNNVSILATTSWRTVHR